MAIDEQFVSPENSEVGIITGDESVPYDDWNEYLKAVEEGREAEPKDVVIRGRPDYEFNVDNALDNIDLTFNGYVPSKDAIEFFNIIRLVLGEDPEVDNGLMHYFLVDLVFQNIKREQYPYSQEINAKIRLNPRKIAVIASRMSAKALALDSKVYTPTGHTTIRDVAVGDDVLDRDGKVCQVVAKSEVFDKDTYKITLEDGRELVTSGDHDNIVWKRVRQLVKGEQRCKNSRPSGMAEVVLTTEEMYKAGVVTNRTPRKPGACDSEMKYYIPVIGTQDGVIDYAQTDYGFDAYTTGVILGDGSVEDATGFTRIVANRHDIIEYNRHIPYEFGTMTKKMVNGVETDNYMFGLLQQGPRIKKWIGTARSYDKRVPELLMRGSYFQRMEVLKGLMDTDGTVYEHGYCSFTSVSKGLAEDVRDLVRSLGGIAFITESVTNSPFGKAWSTRIKINKPIFKLTRKLKRQHVQMTDMRVGIKSIEKIDNVPTQCIAVSSPTKSFITDGYTVTHNSTVLTAYLPIYAAITGKIPNFGKIMFMVGFGDSQQGGAKVQANTIRDFCSDSAFCKQYFEKMRFTDEECEFIRKGNGRIKDRAFMYKVKGAAGGSVRGIRYRTERPACHAAGTKIMTDHGVMKVEDYPYNYGAFEEYGKVVQVRGLVDKETVSSDHKYWARLTSDEPAWVEAQNLTNSHLIGDPSSGSWIWRQVKSVEDTEDKVKLIPITCFNAPMDGLPKHTYLTSFGLSKNCFLFDDIIKNESDAASPVIMKKLRSMIYADAENALGSKGMIIAVNTPFNKADPIYSALESGIWTPICLPICEKIDLDLKKKDFVGAWPAMHTYEKTMERYEDAYYGGTLREFNQELMLRISSEEDKMIKDDMVQWYDRQKIVRALGNFTVLITTDFTASGSKKGDFSGIAVWAIGADDDKFLIDIELQKRTIQEQYDALFRMVSRYGKSGRVVEVGMEIDGQQQLNMFALKQMMIEKNMWFRFAKQKGSTAEGIRSRMASGSKFERFKYMMPSFENKKMWFPESLRETADMKELLEELKYVTFAGIGSKHDDGLDLISQLGMIDYLLPSMSLDEIEDKLPTASSGIWGKMFGDDDGVGSNSQIF